MNTDKQVLNPAAYPHQPVYEDEISLVDIVRILIRRKNLIIGITIISVLIGLVYAFTTKRVYQVETILFPPSIENIQPLNVLTNSAVNSAAVFSTFVHVIESRKLQKMFFDKSEILEIFSKNLNHNLSKKEANDLFRNFSESLKVNVDKKTSSTRITLQGIYKNKIGNWLDNLVKTANQETINQLVKNLQANIESKIKNITIGIASKRSIYKKRHEDELGRLQEAYEIAKSLGIRNHLFVPSVDNKSNNVISSELKGISNRLSNTDNLSYYMKGTKVLQAEMNAIKNRKSDDLYIMGLRDLQEKLTRLEAIKIKKNKLQAIIVDKKAAIDIKPIRPKRKLILILSFVLGGMLGIFGVFIMEFMGNLNNEIKNNNPRVT